MAQDLPSVMCKSTSGSINGTRVVLLYLVCRLLYSVSWAFFFKADVFELCYS